MCLPLTVIFLSLFVAAHSQDFGESAELTTSEPEAVTLADHTSLPFENKTSNWFAVADEAPTRSRRVSIFDYQRMFGCVGTCSGWAYNGYGCYCGLGGSGSVVDGIDQCCKDHDACYERTRCPGIANYAISSTWSCTPDGVQCGHERNRCYDQKCRCDAAMVNCVGRFACPKQKKSCPSKKGSWWGK